MRSTDRGRPLASLPLGPPLLAAMLLVLLADRAFGLTSFAVAPQGGFVSGTRSGGVGGLLTDVVAVLVLALVLLGVQWSARPRTRGGLAMLLVVASLVALQFGALVVESTTGVPVPDDLNLARGLLLTGATMAALHLLGELAQHRRTTRELRGATASADALASSGRATLARLRDDVAGRVQQVLRDALAALEIGGPGGSEGSAARLRALADEVVRPLSHRLASTPALAEVRTTQVTEARWRDTLGALLRTPVVPPRLLALIAAVQVFLRSLVTDQGQVRDLSPAIPPDADGVGVALTVDVVPLLAVLGEIAFVLLVTRWGAVRLVRVLERRRGTLQPADAWSRVVVGIGGIAVVAAIAPTLVESLVALAQGGPWRAARGVAPVTIIASFIPLFTVTIGVSLAAAVAAERADLTAQLARQRSEAARAAARVQAVLGHEQRRLARSLHADLQATINAAGMMLERADRAGGATPEHFDEVAARIATSVERLLEEGASTLPLVARLAEVRALWAGVCAVGLELDAAATARIDADPVTRELLVDLVTEACANAVVHGDAARIDVRIGLVEDEVELDISDDGTRRAPAGDAGAGAGAGDGLGTEVLRMSCTSFSVDVGAHGTRLHAMVPLG